MRSKILSILNVLWITTILLSTQPFFAITNAADPIIYHKEQATDPARSSEDTLDCAVYLGVQGYGRLNADDKDVFIHHFSVNGQKVAYMIVSGKNDGYPVQNALMEGYIYDLTITDGMITNAGPAVPIATGPIDRITDTALLVDGHEIKIDTDTGIYEICTQPGGAMVSPKMLDDLIVGMTVKVFRNGDIHSPAEAIYLTSVPKEYCPPVMGSPGQRTLKNFLATAMGPVGTSLYVYGGAWNWQDDASDEQVLSIGLPQSWVDFFQSQDQSYTFKNSDDPTKSYYPFGRWNQYHYAGPDCSGYLGWVIYNTMNDRAGQEDIGIYVGYSTNRADVLARAGLGTRSQNVSPSTFRPGDIFSMKGHVWICVGTCGDGSMVILHSTPSLSRSGHPGGGVQLSAIGSSQDCQALSLARYYMQTYYPDWSSRYDVSLFSYPAYTDLGGKKETGRFSWSIDRAVLTDPDGYAEMTAEEILKDLFR